MSKLPLESLLHIKAETAFLSDNYQNMTYEIWVNNGIMRRALERSLEIIGEATKRLPESFRAQHPHIEWRKLSGLRDIVIHHYDDLN